MLPSHQMLSEPESIIHVWVEGTSVSVRDTASYWQNRDRMVLVPCALLITQWSLGPSCSRTCNNQTPSRRELILTCCFLDEALLLFFLPDSPPRVPLCPKLRVGGLQPDTNKLFGSHCSLQLHSSRAFHPASSLGD